MLFSWVSVALVFQCAKSADDTWARFGRFDDGVDVALLGCYKRIREPVAKLGDFLLAESVAVGLGSFIQLALVNNIHRALRTHDRDFRGRPGEVGIRADVFAGHNAICSAVGFARDDRDFGNGGFRKSEK